MKQSIMRIYNAKLTENSDENGQEMKGLRERFEENMTETEIMKEGNETVECEKKSKEKECNDLESKVSEGNKEIETVKDVNETCTYAKYGMQ